MQKGNLNSSRSFTLKLKEKYKKLFKICKKYKCTDFLENYKPLSHGRYSVVLLSKDKTHIIKMFFEKGSSEEIKNEIRILQKINNKDESKNCDNIINHLSYSYKKDCPLRYIKYEYCEGSELFCWDTEDLNDLAKFHIIMQLTNAVKHTHDLNIIHCDIKMENIFIKYNDLHEDTDYIKSSDIYNNRLIFKLGDWNLASFKNVRGRLGTTEYMSPEVIRDKHITKKNDIWAIGVVLYQLIYDIFPFTNDRDKITMLLIKRYADGLHNIEYNSSIFDDILKKLLEPDITKRLCIEEVIENLVELKIKILENFKDSDDDQSDDDQSDDDQSDDDQSDYDQSDDDQPDYDQSDDDQPDYDQSDDDQLDDDGNK
jgi:serine/threonine protein kinase